MAGKVIDATLRFVDKFTAPMQNAVKHIEKSSKSIQRAGKEIEKTGRKISKAGSTLTKGVTAPILAAGVASFELASDLNESMNKVDVSFKKNSKNVKDWSKTTLKNYGIAQGTALDMASAYGDMGTSMGLSTKKAAKMSETLVARAGDLASFKNISSDVAKTALNGIFSGETESLKQLGVVMTDTNLQAYAVSKGMLKSSVSAAKMKEMSLKVSIAQQTLAAKIKKYGSNSIEAQKAQMSLNTAIANQAKTAKGSLGNLSQSQKVMLRYKYVMDMTKNSQGDFARTLGSSAANQQRVCLESLKQIGATLGTKLLPVGLKVLKWANAMMDKFGSLSDKQQDMVIKIAAIAASVGPALLIFGKITSGVGGTIKTIGALGGAVSKGAKAFDKLKNVGKIGTTFSKFGNVGKAAFMAMTSPAGITMAVILAIAVAAFLIIKNWTKIKTFFTGLGAHIKKILKTSGVDIDKYSKTFSIAKQNIEKAVIKLRIVFNKIITFLKPIIAFLRKAFIVYWKVTFSVIRGYLSGVLNGIIEWTSGVTKVFNGIVKFLSGVFTGNWKKALEGIKEIFGGVFTSLIALAKTPINVIIGMINSVVPTINKLGIKIPKWVPVLGGKSFSINIPKIPMLYKGTPNWQGGLAITQDRGGEVMDLPKGTRVYPHDESLKIARREGARSNSGTIVKVEKIADNVIIKNGDDYDIFVNKFATKLERRLNNTGKVVPA